MKEFLQLMRRFVSPYKKYIGWAIVLNVLSAVFNVFSFTLLIPILNILFKTGSGEKVYHFMECGMGFAKAFGVTLTDNQVKNLLEGKKILVKGITNKAGKVYDAYLTPNGTTSYSYTDAKGNTRSGFQYSFNMEFPKKK